MSDRIGETEQQIRRYLLGASPSTEQAYVEEQLMTDEGYFQSVELTEDSLLDDYIFGRLSGSERNRFEQHYLSTPERLRRLATARALTKIVADDPVSNKQGWIPAASTRTAWWLAFAAGLLVCLLGVSYIAKQREFTARERRWQEAFATKDVAIKDLEQQVQRAEDRSSQSRPTASPVFAALLQPDMILRGNPSLDKVQSLRIPPGSEVQLHLIVTPDEDQHASGYRAVIKTAGGHQVWASVNLAAVGVGGRRTISLKLPRGVLASGAYHLELFSMMDSGSEQVERYSFSVVQD